MQIVAIAVPRKPKTLLMALITAGLMLTACGQQGTPTQTAPTAKPAATVAARPSRTPQPTPTKPALKLGAALEWHPIAEQAAAAWQADAVLHSVVGGNIAGDGSSLACDGRAELWTYDFISVAAQKKLTVAVRAGAVSSKADSALTRPDGSPATAQDMESYSELYAAADWKVDSTQAAQTTNALFKAKYNVEPEHIAYVMFNTKYLDVLNNKATNWMRWVISYDPEKYPFQAKVDARTGEVKDRP